MKVTRNKTSSYTVTGYTSAWRLAQYQVEKNAHIWTVTRIYGDAPEILTGYATKAEAVKATNLK